MKKAFTLIELLIVVAIIAILAAIAVPNFIEAQTRSKVARVKSDLRTIRVAMEAYAIDTNGKYPHLIGNRSWTGSSATQITRGPFSAAYPLSTPIAYMTTTYMLDPFCPAKYYDPYLYLSNMTSGSGNLQATFSCVNSKAYFEYAVADGGLAKKFPGDRPAWWVCSLGPDYMMGPDARTGGNWTTTYYGSTLDPQGKSDFIAWMYDPSNGTVSHGDIWVNQWVGSSR